MYCTECGKSIADGTKFCPFCGKKQIVVEQTSEVEEEKVSEAEEEVVAEEKKAAEGQVVPETTEEEKVYYYDGNVRITSSTFIASVGHTFVLSKIESVSVVKCPTWKHSIGFIISVIVLLFIFELSDAMFLKGLCIVETLVSLWQLIVVSQKYFLRLTIASKTVKSGVSGKIDYINKVFNALNEAIEQNNKK